MTAQQTEISATWSAREYSPDTLLVPCRIETSGSPGRFRTRASSLVRPQSSSQVLIYLPREIAVQLTTTELRKLREPRPSGTAISWGSHESEPYERFSKIIDASLEDNQESAKENGCSAH